MNHSKYIELSIRLCWVALLLVSQGCLSFRYSVKAETSPGQNTGRLKEVSLVRVAAKNSDKFFCYLTFWAYGGYCWFVMPDEDSDRRALEKARGLFEGDPKSVSVEYLGRD